jgi:SAM-dependent methyltransferase
MKKMDSETRQHSNDVALRIDLGCGGSKREGFIGLDSVNAQGVDFVLDLTKDRLPFDDGTVDHVFSSHFLEHIPVPNHLFQEIARICKDRAKIEIYTPYAFSSPAFLYGHVAYLAERQWFYFCCQDPNRDFHLGILGGRWLLHNIHYVVPEQVQWEILDNNFSIDFAIRYFKDVVEEFGVEIEFRRDLSLPPIMPRRTYSNSRYAERVALPGISELPVYGAYKRSGGRSPEE